MFDVGDTVTLTYPTKPTSPATVTVTIGLPDGTTAGPTSATSGSYSYVTTQPGRHTVLWVATGPSDAHSDTFDVAPADAGGIISLADAKAHFRITQSTNDEDLRLYIAATTALIEHVTGPVVTNTHVEVVDAAETIILANAPVLAVTSIAPTLTYTGLTFALPTWLLDGPAGILRAQPSYPYDFGFSVGLPYGQLPQGLRLTVTYTAGRQIIPAPLQLAARIILEHLWETRRLAGPKPASADELVQDGRDTIPEAAKELLAPYRRSRIPA